MALCCSTTSCCVSSSNRAVARAASRPAPLARTSSRVQRRTRAAPEDGGEDLSGLLKDLERFQQRSGASGSGPSASSGAPASGVGGAPASSSRPAAGQGAAEEPSPFKEALDKLLIADFFLVLAILGWLGLGLGVQGALHSSVLLDAWYPLWPLVFQPAIGVLMLGALVSGGLGWLKEQEEKKGD
ncbi:hypothetical protein MNEG_13507 [Monoraphidium neglectum]|uniref:Uncharacterized protein n=1 Tax=Monoraphidium neglectum TaxID=145388 RepID=A0A0D2MHD1_9CHLO|nr:hypothetical protein MNEG_13507 [Monoraphidium neglectum]KIY94455.1 hypothetical protein MNEG_13507 [Monoraphidium neglectum]|eukprot:XP_013893475.1 hypothetical protein MNEG_13507 [Monoraphidium neglectum]